MTPISTNAPTVSASTNRQPIKSHNTKPNSKTRLVDANMNASVGTRAAPFLNAARAAATAA